MLIFLLYGIENIIIIRYYEKKNMRVASVAHIIFSIVFGLYILFIPMFDLSMLLTVSRSDTPIRTLAQILLYSEELSFTNIGTFTSIQLVLFYLLIFSTAITYLEITSCISVYIKNDLYFQVKKITYLIYTYLYLPFTKIFIINCRFRN